MEPMLLEEFNVLNQYEILSEGEGRERRYALRGVFSKCGVPNKNKRVYPMDVLKPVVESLQEDIENGAFVGELDHPPTPKVNMDKISHKITKLSIAEDGAIVGEIIPAGPKKYDLIRLMEDKIRIGVSTRGIGGVKPYSGPLGEGLVEVQPGYKMKAIDIVFDPSESNAIPETIIESTDDKIIFATPSNFKAIWDEVFSK